MSKQKIRNGMKLKRRSIDLKDKINKDLIIQNKFLSSTFYKNCKNLFIYVSLKDEVSTHNIIKIALADKKRVFVPKIINIQNGMKAVEIMSFSQLIPCGKYSILEPSSFENQVDKKNLDLAIIPGLAFDLKGGRLGYGGGFYDKFFKNVDFIYKIGFCYDFQILHKVPMNETDVVVDFIISDKHKNK